MRNDIWDKADDLVREIKENEPVFGKTQVSIVEFGAVSCNEAQLPATREEEIALVENNTRAICATIDYISRQPGGGTVLVPGGIYYTGPIHLESDVRIHLEEDACLRFATETACYTGEFLKRFYGVTHVLTRFEGVELYNYSPFIYAYGKTNIAITGRGTLDGQASEENWHLWKQKRNWSEKDPNGKRLRAQDAARVKLFRQGESNVPVVERVYGEATNRPGCCDDGYLRPSFVQPYNCSKVLIENVRIIRSPMWEIHPVLCNNVTVRGVQIDTHLSNNDGVDPECCKKVLIEQCRIDVGDDCVAIKSGRNNDARRVAVATEDVVIQNNIFADGHGGITIGSELTGGVRRIYVRNNIMESPRLWSALRFKTNQIRGGRMEQCYYADNTVRQLEPGKKPVLIETMYETIVETAIFREVSMEYTEEVPVVRDIYIEGFRKEDADIRGDNIVPDIHWI